MDQANKIRTDLCHSFCRLDGNRVAADDEVDDVNGSDPGAAFSRQDVENFFVRDLILFQDLSGSLGDAGSSLNNRWAAADLRTWR